MAAKLFAFVLAFLAIIPMNSEGEKMESIISVDVNSSVQSVRCLLTNKITLRNPSLTGAELLRYSEFCNRFDHSVLVENYSVICTDSTDRFIVVWNSQDSQIKEDTEAKYVFYLSDSTKTNNVRILQLIPGVSTLDDVIDIDPWVEFIPYLSHVIVSYSYYGYDQLIECEYSIDTQNRQSSYTVENIRIVNRADSFSCTQNIDYDIVYIK